MFEYDVLIIGNGVAGLSLALNLPSKYKIAVLCKQNLQESATFYAQGGIAAVLSEKDNINAHIQDTLNTGQGLSDKIAVAFVVQQAAECITWLSKQDMPFDKNNNHEYHLSQEGGHSYRRIVHAKDATGLYLNQTLVKKVKAHQNITTYCSYSAIDLIIENNQCIGAYVLDQKNNQVTTFLAKKTAIATGGISALYQYSSSPTLLTGDGMAMAWRAGCSIVDLEFMQFHPTTLYQPESKRAFLLTEALRGEGAYLTLKDGKRFMFDYHPKAELAPRDIVSKAIYKECQKHNIPHVYLDISHKPLEFIQAHFPTLYQKCLNLGFDMSKQALPVVPAAHYTCGGIKTNLQGQTEITHLYSIGESSYIGLHGANRLASNSLLECLVLAKSAAEHIKQTIDNIEINRHFNPKKFTITKTNYPDTMQKIHTIRKILSEDVGIIRTNQTLNQALKRINQIKAIAYTNALNQENLNLNNMLLLAKLLIQSASLRKESRGTHYNQDYPETAEKAEHTILKQE